MKKNRLVALLLGGGRRVSMAQLLKRSAERLGIDLEIVSYELERQVPIAVEGEVVTGLRWDDPDIEADVVRVAIEHEANIVLPFADGAIPVAAKCAAKLGHTFIPYRNVEGAETFYDRSLSAKALKEAGIPAPTDYTVINAEPPVIAKPRRGSTARNIKIFHDIEDLMSLENLSSYVLQEYIEDFDEYEIEAYIDMEGQLLACVPVKLLEVLGGEPTRAITERIPELETLCRKVSEAFSLRGPILIEVLFDRKRHRFVVTHIAPRPGDAAGCAVYSGAPLTDYIIKETCGIGVAPCDDWADHTLMTCYRKEAIFFNS
ncbi:MAG: ATP-grasp domain-containing protein [Clostridium sp.]|nr:ATP-grasp domain-containing protein [Prevotella sp.]MCM1429139.1 ATP-grasp domain-containing protein [Clostridium sp.]MCM1475333.1 ATP-grasp domain-containing protein [Muribaculaceae bacterium]